MMEKTRHINSKSDFVLRERFRDADGNTVALPDVDFTLRYWVKTGRIYEASRKGGTYTNCVADGDAVLVVFKDHRLGEGTLKHELHLQLDNALFDDGVQNVYYPDCLNIELWQWSGDTEGVVESDLMAAYTRGKAFTWEDFTPEQLAELKGEKGDPFTWEDFTAAQIEILKKPAIDAAATATAAAKKAETAAANAERQAKELKTASDDAIGKCGTATKEAQDAAVQVKKAGETAVNACNGATAGAQQATADAQAATAQAEQTRQKLEEMAAQVEAAASNIPTGLRVDCPEEVTLGNTVAQYVTAKVKPDYAQQNVLYLSDSAACDVEPDGRIVARRAGTSRVHVIPTAGVRYYKTVSIAVVPPRMRMAGNALRLDKEGNIRLT